MNNACLTLAALVPQLYQITVTLKPGEVVTDQNITLGRWLAFSGSVLGMGLCLALLWVNSAAEAGLTNLSRQRIQAMRERLESRAQIIEELLNHPTQVASVLNLVDILCLILITALAITAIHQFNFYGVEVTIMVIVLAFVVMSLARTLPRGYALNRPERAALRFSSFINLEVRLARPLVWLVNKLANIVLRTANLQPIPAQTVVTEEEVGLLANIGQEDGLIQEDERALIEGVFQFGDTVVREVMWPRLDIKAIPSTARLEETLDRIISSGKSRLPVYEPDIDHILGILYAKDVLRYIRDRSENSPFDIKGLLRPVYYVPESKKVDQLFEELQKQRVHIAIVVDEYGGTAGLVTIEDLLEEIVGEIQDEYDSELPSFEHVGLDEVWVDARLNLDAVNQFFKTHWESEDTETIGGFVYDKLGRIPAAHDALIVDQAGRLLDVKVDGSTELAKREMSNEEEEEPITDYYRISVLKVTGQRLRQLRLQHIEAAPHPAPIPQPDISRPALQPETRETERRKRFEPASD